MNTAIQDIQNFVQDFLSLRWFVRIVRQIVISAGTVAASALIVATFYVTINVVAHQLLTWIFPSTLTVVSGKAVVVDSKVILILNQVALIIFACIPELIIVEAVSESVGHWGMFKTTKNKWALVWAILHTVPTVIFLIMTIVTILSFVNVEASGNTYKVEGWNLSVRVLFGWIYSVAGMLFESVGRRGYAETVADLRTQNEALVNQHQTQTQELQTKVERINEDLAKANQLLHEHKSANEQLIEEMQKTDDATLQAYGNDCLHWLKSGSKTVSLDEITRFTGHSKRKIGGAIKSGDLQVSSRNKELVTVSSLLQWLKNIPAPTGKTETPTLHLVNE
jgi:hypothetical protein